MTLPPSPEPSQVGINVLDRTAKLVFNEVPEAAFLLHNIAVNPNYVHREDTAINAPELRTDHVFILRPPGEKPYGIQQEYQGEPDPSEFVNWELKNAVLNRQLKMPVFLVVIYLRKGSYATFPATYTIRAGGLVNSHHYLSVELWKYRDRIRSGDLQMLAPLLVLTEEEPRIETLEEERVIIQQLPARQEVKENLTMAAILLGARYFPAAAVRAVFGEDLQMLKEVPLLQEWLEESKTEGLQQGRREAAQTAVLRVLHARFGDVPEAVEVRVRQAEAGWCEDALERALGVASPEELL